MDFVHLIGVLHLNKKFADKSFENNFWQLISVWIWKSLKLQMYEIDSFNIDDYDSLTRVTLFIYVFTYITCYDWK